MKLSRRERAQILEACELIDTGRNWWCCAALNAGVYSSIYSDHLVIKFCAFFNRKITEAHGWWDKENTTPAQVRISRDEKILALLFFLEGWE